jgi:chaperonin GroEL
VQFITGRIFLYTDTLKTEIINPTKATRIALENAASVAGMILTTAGALIHLKEENTGRNLIGGATKPMM